MLLIYAPVKHGISRNDCVPKYLGTVPSGVGGDYDTPTTVSFSKITTLFPQTMAVDQKLENVI